jgi:TonB-linked SusC/RagA family outer membrane protein
MLCFASSFAVQLYAQNSRQISINKQNVTFEEIVRDVESQTDYTFMYSTETARSIGRVSINVSNVTVKQLMDLVLTGKPYTYLIENNVVILKAKNQPAQTPVNQKATKITGVVTEADGRSLPGASVLVKGTQIGVMTSDDGSFEIDVPQGQNRLVISFIGKKSQEVDITGKSSVNIKLEDDELSINQVVFTGIFKKSRESYTGAVTSISAKELQASGNRNILTSIRNIDPSFNIVDNLEFGSDPNRLPDITIRGRTSMDVNVRNLQEQSSVQSTSNLPLFIMDGFEVSLQRVMDMDEEQVENITLLKDASATAMYGSRGANGIVVITLKRPEVGKLRVSYRGSINIEAPDFTSYNLMNATEKLQYEKAANLYYSIYNSSNQNLQELYNQRLIEVVRGVDTYWLKYPVTTGIGNRHSLRVDGGADNFNYAGSISYNNIMGVMKESSRNNFTGNLFFQYALKNIKFQNDLYVIYNKNTNSPYGDFSEYTTANPIYTPYDDEGHLKKILVEPLPSTNTPQRVGNPLYNATLPTRDDGSYTNFQNNFAIEWKINSDLTLRGNLGVIKQDMRTDNYLSRDHTSFDTGDYTGENFNMRGSYTYTTGYLFSYEGTVTLNYSKTFKDVHQLYAGFSANIAEEKNETYSVQGRGFSSSNMKNLGMAGAYAVGKPYSTEQHSRRIGSILNVNYTYDRRYFADFSGKIEGSSKFGSNDRMAPFWSAGLGWNLHNEAFFSNLTAINSLRLRLSYGTTGSQNFSSFQALTTYRYFGQENYKFWNGAYMLGLGNPDLSWQKTKHTNIGMETSFFNGRVRLNVDYYNKLTEALLTDINLPPAGGFPSYKANVGEVRNRGVELDANVFIIRNSNRRITWSVGGNLAHNANQILKISNALEFLNSELMKDAGPNPSFLYKEGQSMNTIFVVQSLGIDPATGQELFVNRLGERVYTWDAQDKVPCGVNEPKIWGNLRTMVRWKNFSLNATMSYRAGGYIYNQTLVDKVENISLSRDVNNPWGNLDKRALYERWQNPGDRASFKNIRDFNTTYASSRFVMKENALSLNSLNLTYEFNNEWLGKNLKMDFLSIGLYAEDVFYLSTIKQERGLYYPFARKYSISISARF